MAKRKGGLISTLVSAVLWLTGVIVSLSVGFAMIDGVLNLPSWLGGLIVAQAAGWVVIVLTIIGVVLAIINNVK